MYNNDPYSQNQPHYPPNNSQPIPQPTGLEAQFNALPGWGRWGLIGLSGSIFVGSLILLVVLMSSALGLPQPEAAAVSIQQPIAAPTPSSTPVSTVAPAATAPTISITHGRPQLGGPVSDFYGKYGQPVGDARPDSTLWNLDSNNAYTLVVHYDASTYTVNYITYAGSSDWSKEQYKDFLLTFAPDGTTENIETNTWWKNQGGDVYDPIAYTSPTISKFFLHISDGSGYANTV